jgi:hypothetical protein
MPCGPVQFFDPTGVGYLLDANQTVVNIGVRPV